MSEPLVLLPPMLCDARVFAPQIDALSADRPVMFVPTHHGERIEEIASALLSVAPPRFALAGMGMGGAVALEIMRRAPERVNRMALISTSFTGETPQGASAREPLIVAARSGRYADAIAAELRPDWLAPGPTRLKVLQLVSDMAHALGPEGYVQQARAMQRRKDQQSTLRKMRCPVLILCGQEDTLLPVKRHQFLSELITDAKLHVVAGAGHLPTLEEPGETTAALRAWLRQPLVLR